MKTIGIVACCKTKRASTQAARDLYCSPLFRKSVAYLRRFWCPTDNDWFILSAEHGLVASSQMIQPYDKTLHALTGSERKAWSLRVLMQLRCLGFEYFNRWHSLTREGDSNESNQGA